MTTIIPLDLNESYWLLDEETYEACKAIPKHYFGTYPDYRELVNDIAGYVGVPANTISIAPGSDEAIRASIALCKSQGLRALVPPPTFSGYERVLMDLPLEELRVYYKEENGAFIFPHQEVLAAIRSGAIGALFLCQPNNPLGSALDRTAMYELLDAAASAGILAIIDEAYAEYIGQSVVDRVNTQKLIVLRSLSKAFGVPGIRVGYSVANPEIAAALSALMSGTLPWPIAGSSVHAARTVIARADILCKRRELLIEQQEKFSVALQTIPQITVYPSQANFLLMRIPHAELIAAELLQNSIRVGLGAHKTWDVTAQLILHDTLRLAVPSPEDMPVVLNALKQAAEQS